jgi:class 3 adenylate cyclase/tetratricopeptide (TPR) repeat protein
MTICHRCGHENPAENRFCGSCGQELDAGAGTPRQERKTITVLFADLVGFTSTAERMDPEDVRAMLSPYYARLRGELERHGGTVEKFIGDAVVALFGAPVAHEDDPERAVRAALAIRDWIADEGQGLQVRIAVNTGEALVTLDARPGEGEGMAAGDVVNTAARLQAAAPVNGILVGETTYLATRDSVDYREADPVEAKGKAAPIAVWEAVQAWARFGVDVSQQARSPLIGRARELGLLVATLDRVMEERAPQLVTLVGVPGIGKSRLVFELFEHVDRDPNLLVTWRQGRSLPYGEGVAFWALAEMVKSQAGILESDSPEEAAQKLGRVVDDVIEDETERQWVLEHLAPLIGMAAEGAGEEVFTPWRRFLEALAERRPLVLVFEDLHWADDGMLDFVDHLVDWSSGVPVLVVGTARPELLDRRPGWGGGKSNAATVSLSPLSDEESARLVGALLERPVLPAVEQRSLLERIGGNPLYAEQFVRMVTERGLSEEAPLPETVQGIIAARLDGLPALEKELIQDAAVMGKVFWLSAVAGISGSDRPAVEQGLHGLERKEFLRRAARSSVAGETEFAFRHILLRDVAYGQIPRASRSEKHRRAAQWIESLGRPEDHAEFVAHHYWTALELARAAGIDDPGLIERVVSSSELAADRAMSLASFAVAAELYGRALSVVAADDPRRPRLLARCGNARFTTDGSGLDMMREAVGLFLESGDVEGAAEAATRGARASWYRGDHATARELIDQAVALVRDGPPSRAKGLALVQRASFHMFMGENQEAIQLAREGLAAAEAAGHDEARVHALNVIGTSRSNLGDADGIRDIQAAVALGREVHEFDRFHASLNNLAIAYWLQGRVREAAEVQEELGASVERYGKANDRTWNEVLAAERYYIAGRWDEALRVLDAFIDRVEAGSPDYMEASCRVVRTAILIGRGDLPGAERESESALAAGRRGKDAQTLGPALVAGAAVAFASGRRDEARRLMAEMLTYDPVAALLNEVSTFEDALMLLLELGMRQEIIRIVDSLPAAWPWVRIGRAIGQGDLATAADILGKMPYPVAEAVTRLRAAEAMDAAGRREDAQAQLELAVPFFRQAGATGFLRRAEALLETGAQAG